MAVEGIFVFFFLLVKLQLLFHFVSNSSYELFNLKAGGGVAVALFTPWCAVKLLQINWESRENLEAVLPSVVQWVRENYGKAEPK